MGWTFLRGIRRDSDQVPTIRGLVARLQELEDRMDRDEAVRSNWIGTVKRTLARINKANDRADEQSDGVVEQNGISREELQRRAGQFYFRGS